MMCMISFIKYLNKYGYNCTYLHENCNVVMNDIRPTETEIKCKQNLLHFNYVFVL